MAATGVSRRAVARVIAAKLIAEPNERSKWLAMGAAYLIERGQVDRSEQLVKDIAREIEVQSGTVLASVTSAHELDGPTLAALESYLTKVTGAKSASLSVEIQPDLLSGLIVKTPDYELNTTARSYLRRLASLEA